MNITVPGAAGFFASHLLPRLLAANHLVTGIDLVSPRSTEIWRIEPYLGHPNFNYVWADIGDILIPSDADALIHLAAVTDVAFANRSPFYTYGQIAGLTLRLAKEAARAGVGHFIYFSTHSVYGRQAMPVHERCPLLAQTSYGAAKIGAEAAVRAIGAERNLPYTVLRPSLMYGERERPGQLVSTFLRLASEGRTITLDGGGQQTRDLNHAGNVVDAVLLVLSDGPHNQIYNVGSGEEISIRQLAEMAVKETGAGSLADGPSRAGEEGRLVLDSRKLRSDLGWSPRVNFETGFKEVAAWYKERLKEPKEPKKPKEPMNSPR